MKDFRDIKRLEHVKRGIEVACIGNFHLLLLGPNYSGKRTLADITMEMMNRLNKSIIISIAKPCPCGNFTDYKKKCTCSPLDITKHLAKIWKLHQECEMVVEVPHVAYQSTNRNGEATEDIETRIKNTPRTIYDNVSEIELSEDAHSILKTAVLELGISITSYDSIMRIARVIADMDPSKKVEGHHISEAIGYRILDRSMWD